MTNRIDLPDFSLIVLVGVHGAGKSTFARTAFDDADVVSRDTFRKETGFLAEIERRLLDRRRVVVDAPNTSRSDRVRFARLAQASHAPAVAVVLSIKPAIAIGRTVDPKRRAAIEEQHRTIRNHQPALLKEGFSSVHDVDASVAFDVQVEFVRANVDRREERGPFDVVGDLHGCFDEAIDLVRSLGYVVTDPGGLEPVRTEHPDGRRLCLVGDLVDRGPDNVGCLRLAMGLADGDGFVVPGNHDHKLMRALKGDTVKIGRNLSATLDELRNEADPDFCRRVANFLHDLPHHLWLDGGALVLSHAGTPADMIGRDSKGVRQFCLYGKPSDAGESGRRVDWARDYAGEATVVHGHVVVPRPTIVNRVVDVDTGCAFGGDLTALRWPEMTFASTPARKAYAERATFSMAG